MRRSTRLSTTPARACLAALVVAAALASGGAEAQSLCDAMHSGDPLGARVCAECNNDVSSPCACAISPKYCNGPVKLTVEVRLSSSPVRGAQVQLAGAKAPVATTDATGEALLNVPLDPKTRTARVQSITLGPDVFVRNVAYPKALVPWILKVDRDVTFDAKETAKTVIVSVPSATVFVIALHHDEVKDTWTPARARLVLSEKDQKLLTAETTLDKTKLELVAPPDWVGRELRVEGVDLTDRNAIDLTTLRMPKAGETVFVTLHLGDLMTQLERTRYKVRAMLAQAFGPDIAERATASMRFDVGDYTNASYLDGVMRIPRQWSINNRDAAEVVFHEWGHRVIDVLAADAPFDDVVGGVTEAAWSNARSPWVAWDEARANFFSQLFTASFKYPGDKAYRESTARPYVGRCATCPGFLASAMVMEYRESSQYPNALEVLKDFRAVHDEARTILGHPPRTFAEFVQVKNALADRQVKDGTLDAAKGAARRKHFADTNRRFGL